MKFLIDECLSPELAHLAQARGHEASHIVWLGKAGWPDWRLKSVILDEDWTFVTRNAIDFRGPAETPGTRGQYVDVTLHAGLICLNDPPGGIDLDLMVEMFEIALDDLDRVPYLINQVLEISLSGAEFEIIRYALPPNERPTVRNSP